MDDEKQPLIRKNTYTFNYESVGPNDVQGDLHVQRPVYKQEQLNAASAYERPTKTCAEAVRSKLVGFDAVGFFAGLVPVLQWLPHYRWKRDFFGDLVSGITVAIMHIPQGMAYGILGNVPPIVGIYMAFFPVLIYFFLGTSRHVSMGTFAIVCLMTGKVVSTYATDGALHNATQPVETGPDMAAYTPIQVATTVTFSVAIIQMAMYVLRLGVITTLLSETLVNGFTCASACHVVASQMKDLMGLPIRKRRGLFSCPYTAYDVVLAIPDANRAAVSISLVSVVLMVINNEIFKPWLAKKTKIPFPIELVAVVTGTLVCYLFNFHGNYNVNIVGDIPTGLPNPAMPVFSLIPSIFLECIVITMVSYSITMSMAFIFAQKDHYEVDPNQELFAMSASNAFGSFFSAMPFTASLSRSLIQYNVGGVTQIASVVSCLLLLIVLLWVGPFFETLPRCVLASIIVVALKGMLIQMTSLKKFWVLNKWDAVVWLVTFLTTVLVAIDIGLAAGICVSLISIFIQGHVPYTCLLGVVPNTDLYLDLKRYKGVQEIEGIKIFHYCGALNFASKSTFKSNLSKRVGFDPSSVLTRRKRLEENGPGGDLLTKCVLLDFSALTYIDPAGVEMLRLLAADYEQLEVAFYVANCSGPVYETLKKCDRYEEKVSKLTIYPTIHDAVLHLKMNVLREKKA